MGEADDSSRFPRCGRLGLLVGRGADAAHGAERVRISDCACAVMTPDILVTNLMHAAVRMTEIALLVLDEAHNLRGAAPYMILHEHFYRRHNNSGRHNNSTRAMREHCAPARRPLPSSDRPRVLAISATPLISAPPVACGADIRRAIEGVEADLDCRAWKVLTNDGILDSLCELNPRRRRWTLAARTRDTFPWCTKLLATVRTPTRSSERR